MRHLIPLAALLLAPCALADDAPPAADSWSRGGGYAGVSGGFSFGGSDDDFGTVDHDELRYTDSVAVEHGWQTTLEGGVVIPVRKVEWMRLRAGAEGGYSRFTLDGHRDEFSGDTVSGRGGFWRVGPAVAADFRIKGTPWSFTAGFGAGAAFLDLEATVVSGGSSRDAGDHQVRPYFSGLVTANYALDKRTELTLGVRSMWLAGANIQGTPTTVGASTYSVRHRIQSSASVELGLRFTF